MQYHDEWTIWWLEIQFLENRWEELHYGFSLTNLTTEQQERNINIAQY